MSIFSIFGQSEKDGWESLFNALNSDQVSLKWLSFLAIAGNTEEAERKLGLPITGDSIQFLKKYYHTFYTERSEVEATPFHQCLQAAASGRIDILIREINRPSEEIWVDRLDPEEIIYVAGKFNQAVVVDAIYYAVLAANQYGGNVVQAAYNGAIAGSHFRLGDELHSRFDVTAWKVLPYHLGKKNREARILALDRERKINWDAVLAGAAAGGHLILAQLAVRKGGCKIASAFVQAVKRNHFPLINWMIQIGEYPFTDLPLRSTVGYWTYPKIRRSLFQAAKNNNLEVIQFVSEHGKLSSRDFLATIISGSIAGNQISLFRNYYVQSIDGPLAIEKAAKYGRSELLSILLSEFLTAEIWQEMVNTALLAGCEKYHPRNRCEKLNLIRMLLTEGADNLEEARDALQYSGNYDPLIATILSEPI